MGVMATAALKGKSFLSLSFFNLMLILKWDRRSHLNVKQIATMRSAVQHFFKFLPTKDLAHFSIHTHKNPSLSDKLSIYCRWYMLSTAKSANVGFSQVVQLFAPPKTQLSLLVQKIPFINSEKIFFWVSTMCAQILGFGRVRVSIRVS